LPLAFVSLKPFGSHGCNLVIEQRSGYDWLRRLLINPVAKLLCVTVVALFPVSAMAQTRPDFSGRWTSEPVPAVTVPGGGGQSGGIRAGDMGSGWGSTIIIAQDVSRLTVEYTFFTRGDMPPPRKFVYALDGSETKNSVMMGRGIQAQAPKTGWEGDKFVITTVHNLENSANGQPVTVEVKRRLALESPTSLIVETTRSGVLGGPLATTRTVYKKN
jgi:hypothetical protein